MVRLGAQQSSVPCFCLASKCQTLLPSNLQSHVIQIVPPYQLSPERKSSDRRAMGLAQWEQYLHLRVGSRELHPISKLLDGL